MEVVPFSNYFAFESSLSLAIAEGERGESITSRAGGEPERLGAGVHSAVSGDADANGVGGGRKHAQHR